MRPAEVPTINLQNIQVKQINTILFHEYLFALKRHERKISINLEQCMFLVKEPVLLCSCFSCPREPGLFSYLGMRCLKRQGTVYRKVWIFRNFIFILKICLTCCLVRFICLWINTKRRKIYVLVSWLHFVLPIFIVSKMQLVTRLVLPSLADKQEAAAKTVKLAFRILYDSFSWSCIFPFQIHFNLCHSEFL